MKKQYIILCLFVFISQSLQAREFLNTVLHLNFGGMYSFASGGDIIKAEDQAADSLIPDNQSTSYYETALCITLDIAPTKPIILGLEDHAIKFGLRGSYKIHSLHQSISMNDENTGKIMDYHSLMIGPVIHYAPFIEPSNLSKDYTAGGGFTFFALWGKINGDMTAYPVLSDKGLMANSSSKVTGYKCDIGVGAELALCSLNIGINIYYSYTNIKMKEEIYANIGRNGNLKEGCFEVYIGIPIESFIEPFIPNF
ncbi:MAG: hypothetical protein FWF73_00460 [Spirochaetes bacterium]|nr:hypothetical protein [Spirochaetota bacterium]